jgi:uncharacterized membrane protein
MQCPACHNENSPQNAFCNHCGAPMAAAATAPAGAAAAPAPTYAMQPVAAAGSGLSENSAAAIAYITIIPAILFLVIEPYNKMPFVRFHAFQSIGLTVVWFALWIVITMLRVVLHFVPLIGLLFLLVDLGICVGVFIVWLIAIMKASKGEWYKLPFIGDFAEKQAGS